MHHLEPHYNWRDHYIASEDEQSPFYGREYSEFEFSTKIYNYFIHPQWDEIGSPTLFTKLLYAEYNLGFAILEMLGEWNDCLHNDISFLKQNVVNHLVKKGINKYILIGENVLNFHFSDDCYYEEWYEDITDDGGWMVAVNFRQHVLDEMNKIHLYNYLHYGGIYNDLAWRTLKPKHFCLGIEQSLLNQLPAYKRDDEH